MTIITLAVTTVKCQAKRLCIYICTCGNVNHLCIARPGKIVYCLVACCLGHSLTLGQGRQAARVRRYVIATSVFVCATSVQRWIYFFALPGTVQFALVSSLITHVNCCIVYVLAQTHAQCYFTDTKHARQEVHIH